MSSIRFRRRIADTGRGDGFSLAEVLIALAIIAIISAIAIPTFAGRMVTGEGQALAAELGALGEGIQNFQANVGAYPGRLDYLVKLPATSGTEPVDICGALLSNKEIASWRGPYTTRLIPLAGAAPYTVGTDTISITLTRTPAAQNSAVRNYIEVATTSRLDSTKAYVVETSFDGANIDYADGNVTWSKAVGTNPPAGTLRYRVPIWGC